MTRDDGGPAFPVSPDSWHGVERKYPQGMSLRDYFAGLMLPAILVSCRDKGNTLPDGSLITLEALAGGAYDLADAMLRVRKWK